MSMNVEKSSREKIFSSRGWINHQIAEIKSDTVLRFFGALLALTHSLTAYFWLTSIGSKILSSEADPICWPGLDFCFTAARLSASQIESRLIFYGYASFAVAGIFCLKRLAPVAWICLLVITIFKFAIMSIDIRTALNAHSIVFIMSAVYLFLPNKRLGLRLSLIAIYFCAGLLKLNQDWLSGDNLSRLPSYLEIFPIKFLTIYVVLLELGIVWLLLSRHALLFWFALIQLVIFQSVAISFIGFYFPSVMLCILMIFPLDRCLQKSVDELPHPLKWSKISWAAFSLGFVYLQVLPHLVSNEPAYNGEGKYFALHMFDSVLQCDIKVKFTAEDQTPKELTFFPPSSDYVGGRLMCNPLSIYWRARTACKKGFMDGSKPVNFDLNVTIKKRTDQDFRPLVSVTDFCTANLKYTALSHNKWILIE